MHCKIANYFFAIQKLFLLVHASIAIVFGQQYIKNAYPENCRRLKPALRLRCCVDTQLFSKGYVKTLLWMAWSTDHRIRENHKGVVGREKSTKFLIRWISYFIRWFSHNV